MSEDRESTVMGTCPIHTEKEREAFDKRENYKTPSPRCRVCEHANKSALVGKTHVGKQNKPLRYDYDASYTLTRRPDGTFNASNAAAFLRRVAKDEVLSSQLDLKSRRPSGVSKERFGVAVRHAAREPMLTANPEVMTSGLDWNKQDASLKRRRVAKGMLYKRIVVKPSRLTTAKYGRNSAFWGEREWLVHTLKYGRGYTITTDIGDDSSVFPTYGELASAIRKSGWEILR